MALLVASFVVVAVLEEVASVCLSASLQDAIVIAAASTIRIFFHFFIDLKIANVSESFEYKSLGC